MTCCICGYDTWMPIHHVHIRHVILNKYRYQSIISIYHMHKIPLWRVAYVDMTLECPHQTRNLSQIKVSKYKYRYQSIISTYKTPAWYRYQSIMSTYKTRRTLGCSALSFHSCYVSVSDYIFLHMLVCVWFLKCSIASMRLGFRV